MPSLFLLGLAAIALCNWHQWQQDRALALRLRVQKTETPKLRETPKVSVLVAAWNESAIIRQHIESFLALRYPHKELILCAGGQDGTYDMARQYASQQVIVLQQQAGEGKQRALRRCLQRATGEIIFLTDADCLLNEHGFARLLAPIVQEGEAATTGVSCPVPAQRMHPFVLHRWFADVYGMARWESHIQGILGRNGALRRDVLATVGDFQTDVHTGTDYFLGKQLSTRGYSVRYVPDSVVETPYVDTWPAYRRQQSRWLRNVVLHELRFGAYDQVLHCLIPSVFGAIMLALPLLGLWLGGFVLAISVLAWLHVLLSRLRYIRFAELVTGYPFPKRGFVRLPAYMLGDFLVWTWTLLQYPSAAGRSQW